MQDRERYISVQIPKTGGSALRDFYTTLWGGEKVVCYYPKGEGLFKSGDQRYVGALNPKLHLLRSILVTTKLGQNAFEILRKFKKTKQIPKIDFNTIPNDWIVLHGHFRVDSIPDQLVKSAKLVTVVREPWKRVISHYNYWNQFPFNEKRKWFKPGMPLQDFVLSSHMENFQTRFLGNSKITDFNHVGITEDLQGYVRYFDPSNTVGLRQVNKSVNLIPIEPSLDLVKQFKEANSDDYQLYEKAKNLATTSEVVFPLKTDKVGNQV